MGRRSQLGNTYFEKYLEMGPFGGLDPTTPAYYVAPTNFPAMSNLIPNGEYGGYVTVPGRLKALASLLPSAPNGIGCIEESGEPNIYLFAVDNAGVGEIWQGQIGGTPTALTLPAALTAGQLTYFVPSRRWVFVSNGTDTPIKIDTSLNVTFWGIVAPTPAPTAATTGVGPLVGTYYYCETFSAADPDSGPDIQESSQGAISTATVAAGAPATLTFTIGGAPTAGDVVTVAVVGIPTQVGVTAGMTVDDIATAMAGQLNLNGTVTPLFGATAVGADVILTTTQEGSAQNTLTGYGSVSSGAGTTITPNTPTNFAGGEDGNSITITPSATTTDPQVTTRNLYRIGGSLGQWTLINSQPVADLTPFLDVTADSALVGQGLTIFRDPPPAWKAIAGYQDRVVGFGTDADPTLVGWSNYNEPWGFDPTTNVQEAGPNNFNDVAVTCGSIGSMLLLLKTRSYYVMVGNSDTTFQVIEGQQRGCCSPTSLAIGENGDAIWNSKRGWQYFNGYAAQTVTDTGYQQSNLKNILKAFSDSDNAISVGFFVDRMFAMSYPSRNQTYLWDQRSSQFYGPLTFALGAVYYDPESADLPVIGSNLENPGEIDQWFASLTQGDLGNPITATALSRITDAGHEEADKNLHYAYVEAPVQPGSKANLYVWINPGIDQIMEAVAVPLDSGTPRHRIELPMGLEGQEMQMMLQTVSLAQVTINKVSLWGTIVRVHKPANANDG